MTYFIGERQCPHEVPKVVGKGEELKPHLVVPEFVTREPRPPDRVFAFFDPLFGSASLVVEMNHAAGVPPEICDDEPHAREELIPVLLDLGHDSPGLRPALRPIVETRMEDLRLERWSPYGPDEQGDNRLPKLFVGRKADSVAESFGL